MPRTYLSHDSAHTLNTVVTSITSQFKSKGKLSWQIQAHSVRLIKK
jgi:hypothetical protein